MVAAGIDNPAENEMGEHEAEFDYERYRQLLAEAVDENKRLALIDLLIEERAMDRLHSYRVARRFGALKAPAAPPA